MNYKVIFQIFKSLLLFIQDFLEKKKYGWGILFFALVAVGIGAYFRGVSDGKENTKEEIKSLNIALNSKSNQIISLEKDAEDDKVNLNYYKKLYDSCSRSLSSQDLNEMVRRQIEKTDALRLTIEKSNADKKVLNKNIKNSLNQQ